MVTNSGDEHSDENKRTVVLMTTKLISMRKALATVIIYCILHASSVTANAVAVPRVCEVKVPAHPDSEMLDVHASVTENLGIFGRRNKKDELAIFASRLDDRFRYAPKADTYPLVEATHANKLSFELVHAPGYLGFVWLDLNLEPGTENRILARIFDRRGKLTVDKLEIRPRGSFSYISSAAPLSTGGFVVAWWQSPSEVPENYLSLVSASYRLQGAPIRVPTQGNEVVYGTIPMKGGGFTVMWDSEKHFFEFFWARRYTPDGTPDGEAFRVPRLPLNSRQGDYSLPPYPRKVGLLDEPLFYGGVVCGRRFNDHDYVAINLAGSVWLQGESRAYLSPGARLSTRCKMLVTSEAESKTGEQLVAQAFSEVGTQIGTTLPVSAPDRKRIRSSKISAMSADRFLVVWEETTDGKTFRGKAAIVDPQGRKECAP